VRQEKTPSRVNSCKPTHALLQVGSTIRVGATDIFATSNTLLSTFAQVHLHRRYVRLSFA